MWYFKISKCISKLHYFQFCHTTECHVTVMCRSPLSMAVSVLWIVTRTTPAAVRAAVGSDPLLMNGAARLRHGIVKSNTLAALNPEIRAGAAIAAGASLLETDDTFQLRWRPLILPPPSSLCPQQHNLQLQHPVPVTKYIY